MIDRLDVLEDELILWLEDASRGSQMMGVFMDEYAAWFFVWRLMLYSAGVYYLNKKMVAALPGHPQVVRQVCWLVVFFAVFLELMIVVTDG